MIHSSRAKTSSFTGRRRYSGTEQKKTAKISSGVEEEGFVQSQAVFVVYRKRSSLTFHVWKTAER